MKQEELARLLAGQPSDESELDGLEEREVEVVSMMSRGLSGAQIEMEMGIAPEELAGFKKSIRKKAGLKNDAELLQFARRQRF